MKTLFLIGVFFCGATAIADEPNEQSKEIPLDHIWGYQIPGTQDIAGIPLPETDRVGETYDLLQRERESRIEQTRRNLAVKPAGEKAFPAYVLSGAPDFYALRRLQVSPKAFKHPYKTDRFPEGEFTLVFFSHPASYYVRIKEVVKHGGKIDVYYQFEPHRSIESTVHFALIPLGTLSADEYEVRFTQVPMDEKYKDAGFEPVASDVPDIICRDFKFTVLETPKDEPPTEGATLIPLDQIWGYQMPGTKDIGKLDTGLSNAIQREIALRRNNVGPAIVVKGTDREALENALNTFANEPEQYTPETELSLFVYSRMSSHGVQITSVEKFEQRIIVKYRFAVDSRGGMRPFFALIPLGKLPAGEYDVEIKQMAPVDVLGRPSKFFPDPEVVCSSTTFRVGKP